MTRSVRRRWIGVGAVGCLAWLILVACSSARYVPDERNGPSTNIPEDKTDSNATLTPDGGPRDAEVEEPDGSTPPQEDSAVPATPCSDAGATRGCTEGCASGLQRCIRDGDASTYSWTACECGTIELVVSKAGDCREINCPTTNPYPIG